MRAGRLAVSAADAVHAVRLFVHRNIKFADFLAVSAFGAFFGVTGFFG